MAEIGEALFTRLSGYAPLIELVAQRIYPQRLPQESSLPAVSIFNLDKTPVHALQTDAGLKRAFYQVSVYAKKFSEAKAVAKQIRACLQDYSGTVAAVVIQKIIFVRQGDSFDDTTETYHIPSDVEIWHE